MANDLEELWTSVLSVSDTSRQAGKRGVRLTRCSPAFIALVYAGLGALWIFATDSLVEMLVAEQATYAVAQLAKGLLYVGVTALLVYWLARRGDRSLRAELLAERLNSYERLFHATLQGIGEAVLTVRPSDRLILDCNTAAEQVFGYDRDELVGRSTELLHVDLEHFERFGRESEEALERGETFRGELRMRRKDGRIIDTVVSVRPIDDQLGWRAGVISVIRDITEGKHADERIRRDLREKQVLLSEIHHRVNNNLNVVTSLLNLQAARIDSERRAHEAFHQSVDRIHSIATVHDKLYQSGSFVDVDMGDYIATMAGRLVQTRAGGKNIELDYDFDPLPLDITRAVPCGLILNELLANALKHAFRDRTAGRIRVALRRLGPDRCELTVADNGTGLPEYLNPIAADSLGFEIVRALTDQIGGELLADSDEGTTIRVRFPVAEV